MELKQPDCRVSFLDYMPGGIRREIEAILSHREGGAASVCEVHLCVGNTSSLLIGAQRVRLYTSLATSDMRQCFFRICSGSVYAHRDTVSEGYVSIGGGIRVGIGAQARYSGGRLVGVCNVNSLLFRIPSASCSLIDRLYSAWEQSKRGMLIYSVAGGGKTTAIRDLSSLIARREKRRVCVIDQRCEFLESECANAGIMLLRGYERGKGVEIALRTLSPEVVVIDEIGARSESLGIIESLLSGVKVLATAHAREEGELVKRAALSPYISAGVFDVLLGIFHTDNTYSCDWKKIVC